MSDMNGLLREVQEDLRLERLEKIWKQYGAYIVAVVVGIILLTIILVFWRDHRIGQREKESTAYNTAIQHIQQGKLEKGLADLDKLINDGHAYNGAAALNKASALAKSDATKAQAIEFYQAISKDKAYDASIRYLAGYYAILHQVDTADPETLLEQLASLMVGANPWSIMVTELKALLTLKAGRQEEAVQIYKDLLSNPKTPSGMRVRIQAALQQNT